MKENKNELYGINIISPIKEENAEEEVKSDKEDSDLLIR